MPRLNKLEINDVFHVNNGNWWGRVMDSNEYRYLIRTDWGQDAEGNYNDHWIDKESMLDNDLELVGGEVGITHQAWVNLGSPVWLRNV